MLNPHQVEAMVHEHRRQLYATADEIHRGAAARRRSRKGWMAQVVSLFHRERPETTTHPSTAGISRIARRKATTPAPSPEPPPGGERQTLAA